MYIPHTNVELVYGPLVCGVCYKFVCLSRPLPCSWKIQALSRELSVTLKGKTISTHIKKLNIFCYMISLKAIYNTKFGLFNHINLMLFLMPILGFVRLIRLITQGTVDNNLGPDRLANPKYLDPNYCRQPTL